MFGPGRIQVTINIMVIWLHRKTDLWHLSSNYFSTFSSQYARMS